VEEEISRADAIRMVLAEGITRPAQVAEIVKERFGIKVPPSFVSVIKYGWTQRQISAMAK